MNTEPVFLERILLTLFGLGPSGTSKFSSGTAVRTNFQGSLERGKKPSRCDVKSQNW